MTLTDFVDALQAEGRYTFRREEAIQQLWISPVAFKNAARRLVAKGRLVVPRRGFLVLVPLEYKSAGAPPPSWFIDDLMAFHGHSYYVGLLTAASLHGAAHQQPQEFQVVTDAPFRPAAAGRARVRFFTKRRLAQTPTVRAKTETGAMTVSTPEATALDLVRYSEGLGGLSAIAGVIRELAESITSDALLAAARGEVESSHAQRLGYLLDLVGRAELGEALSRWLQEHPRRRVPLNPSKPIRGSPGNSRWRVWVNEEIEVEE